MPGKGPEPSDAAPQDATTSSWLSAPGKLGLLNPKLSIVIGVLALIGCAVLAWGLHISTSRYKLVADDNPFQANLLSFFDRFGYPDSLVLVVSGCDEGQRRGLVDKLGQRLEQEPELKGRVLGRVGVDTVAEVLLLMQPDALSQMRAQVDGDPAELIEGGLPAWVEAMNERMVAQLEGTAPVDEEAAKAGPGAQAKQAEKGLLALALMLRAFDATLAGEDAMTLMPADGRLAKQDSVDSLGYVVSSDGKQNLIALFPNLPGTSEGYETKPLVDKVRSIRDEVGVGACTAELTGLPALQSDELVVLEREIKKTSLLTTLGILVLLLIAFRSLRFTILSLLPLGIGMVITLALVRATYGELNLITSSFIPVLLGLGIAFGVFVMSRYAELRRDGAEERNAILGSLGKAGPGIVMGAVTTIMAFLTCYLIEFTAFQEMGAIAAMGLTAMLVVTFLLLPPLIKVVGPKKIGDCRLPGVEALPAIVRRGKWVFPIVALVLLLGGATRWGNIGFNARYFDFLPEDTESASGLNRIESDKLLSPVQASAGAEGVEAARALAAKFRKLETVGSVQSATDMLPPLDDAKLKALRAGFDGVKDPDFDKLRKRKRSAKELAEKLGELGDTLDEVAFAMRQGGIDTAPLDQAKKALAAVIKRLEGMPDDSPQLAALETQLANVLERAWKTAKAVAKRGHYLPTDLPSVFRARFMSKDGKALAVFATPGGNIWEADFSAKFAHELTDVEPTTTGLGVTIHEHLRMIKEGFRLSSLIAAGMVFFIMLAGFRRLDDALYALIPVTVGVCWLMGGMGVLGLDFDVANIVTLPLVLGIGIDAGAHMMHRWRQSADANGGVADIEEVIKGTGAAVLLASLTSAAGFGALATGAYGGMRSLGTAITIGILACLVASLFVLPALLVALKKAR